MPTKIYLKGGANVQVRGDSQATAIYSGPPILRWFKRWARAIAMNGHELEFRKRDVLCYEFQPEAEHLAEVERQRKAQEEQATASLCRRCGTKSPQMFDHCPKCGSQLVKKEPPKPVIPS
jgi:ribosomal protein L40E